MKATFVRVASCVCGGTVVAEVCPAHRFMTAMECQRCGSRSDNGPCGCGWTFKTGGDR